MMEEDDTLDSMESTPSWAVAAVCAVLIALALLIEHALHLFPLLFQHRKRKTLNQALYHIKSELRKLGFMSLLLTAAKGPISKICIPTSMAQHFLPCKLKDFPYQEVHTCQHKGEVSLIPRESTEQLQTLIFILAVFHVFSCLVTFLLGDAKMNKWKSWEEDTNTTDFQLSYDSRRFEMAHNTSFGKRHLNLWSDHPLFLWLVCSLRQFVNPVSKHDYYSLRGGFLKVHFDNAIKFDFHKFIMRSLDRDFVVVVKISLWIWIYAMLFIFFLALEFYHHYWPCFIPLAILSIVGAKLEVIITTMCHKSSHDIIVVPGTVSVTPDNNLFWFNRPQFLLHIIQFVLVQNSFHLAFFIWSCYNFGLRSCYHSRIDDIIITLGVGLLVQFLCAYVTLPLYALVAQMGSSLKTSFFSDNINDGLRRWHKKAQKNLEAKKSIDFSRSSTLSSTSMTTIVDAHVRSKQSFKVVKTTPSLTSKLANLASIWSRCIYTEVEAPMTMTQKLNRLSSRNIEASPVKQQPSRKLEASTSTTQKIKRQTSRKLEASTSMTSTEGEGALASFKSTPVREFNFPSGRLELLEVQKVVEEIIQNGGNNSTGGDLSFRLWKGSLNREPMMD